MTAIVMAESGGNPSAVGDKNNPGPGASSVGLAQINFLPSRDSGNANRDPKANLDPLTNLKAAYKISNGGTNFKPWATYTTTDPGRSYKQFMPDANNAASGMKNSGTSKGKPLTDSQILASLKTTAPWLYKTYTSPAFTAAQKKLFVGWARAAAAGKAPTAQQMAAQTYNWPITQLWNDNQRTMFQKSFENPGQYKSDLAATQTDVDELIRTKGLKVDKTTRDKAINEVLLQGMNLTDPRVIQLLTGTYQYDAAPTTAPTGKVASSLSEFQKTASDYGIPLPTDPTQMTDFVKGAIGPNPDPNAFTEYAKGQAKLLYPWMSGALDAGGTVKNYLQPYATTIANTLGIAPDSIDWTDPKWSSVVAKKDPTGVSVPQTLDQTLATIRTDPRFGFDASMKGKNEAYDLASGLKSMFGRGQ